MLLRAASRSENSLNGLRAVGDSPMPLGGVQQRGNCAEFPPRRVVRQWDYDRLAARRFYVGHG